MLIHVSGSRELSRIWLLLINRVAVEKLAQSEFAKIESRQEALQPIFLSLLEIFYHPIFGFFQKNRVFQQPLALSQVTPMQRNMTAAKWPHENNLGK